MNVLIIDDDSVDRIAVKRTLAKLDRDINLFEAVTTNEAEQVFNDQKIDVVLLDYRLGAENGLDWFRKKYTTDRPGMAVIVISSAEDEEVACQCLEAGAQDFLPKTEITPDRMVRALTQARIRYELEAELRRSRDQMRGLAERDSLTQLCNRRFFEEYLRNATSRAARSDERLALILFDLDRFKHINDRFGHDVGDGILREVAHRVRNTARESDLLARLGGDEFAVLPHGMEHLESASRLAERIRQALSEPVHFAGLELRAEASFGIATYPDSGLTAEELYKSADIAMYRAKNDGRNRVCFFSSELQENMLRRIQLEEDLVGAEKNEQFCLLFQPQVQSDTGRLVALEALLRWQHPTEGLKTPDSFLSIAEETGQMFSLGGWILREACETAMKLNARLKKHLPISVNISAVQLANDDLVEQVRDALNLSGIPGKLLELELTETALLEKPEQASRLFADLTEIGVRIILDDFGTGYSSLAHINDFPIGTLKVDKTFLWNAMESHKSLRLFKSVVALAKSMELLVVVEGVETSEQYDLCSDLGVDRVQGYLISRPLPLEELLSTRRDFFGADG